MSNYRKLISSSFIVEIFQANNAVTLNISAINYPTVIGLNQYAINYKNLTTNAQVEVIGDRFQSIPSSIRNYNVFYEVKAAAVIDGVKFPFLGETKTVKMLDAQPISIIQCGQVLNSSGTITASSPSNIVNYIFRATRVGGSGTYYYKTQSNSIILLGDFTGMTINANSNYLIAVSWTYFDPITSTIITVPYGTECTVTSAP